MNDAVRLLLAFSGALLATTIAVPIAIRGAARTNFLDQPAGYKQHRAPPPYLGGAAVLVGFLVAAIPLGSSLDGFTTLLICAVGLAAVGMIDDRIGLPVWPRVFVEAGAGAAIHFAG